MSIDENLSLDENKYICQIMGDRYHVVIVPHIDTKDRYMVNTNGKTLYIFNAKKEEDIIRAIRQVESEYGIW